MLKKETSFYPIDTNQVSFYFCLHTYKSRARQKLCYFVLLTIQRIKKGKGRYFKRFIKKKESDVLKKKAKVLGMVFGTRQWFLRKDGGGCRTNRNFTMIFRGPGKFLDATKKGGIGGLKTQHYKLRGAVPREIAKKKNLKRFEFLKIYRFRFY